MSETIVVHVRVTKERAVEMAQEAKVLEISLADVIRQRLRDGRLNTAVPEGLSVGMRYMAHAGDYGDEDTHVGVQPDEPVKANVVCSHPQNRRAGIVGGYWRCKDCGYVKE